MAYWLFKSEPHTWSWDDQVERGEAGTEWDGVRNHQAKNQMQKMAEGDLGFFYHSGEERRIVGIVEVARQAHPDSTDETGRWFCVDVRARQAVPHPVPLDTIKRTPGLEDMVLVKNSRLSVQPVTDEEWRIVMQHATGGEAESR